MQMLPADEFNTSLLEQVHPPAWKNPSPRGRYNLVAIGGGTAGIISAMAAAGLKGRAALVERRWLGGDCLNVGCVPSKALLRCARAAWHAQHASQFGISTDVRIDFAAIMQRLRRLRAGISHHDSAQRFTAHGVDVFLGDARFTGPNTLEVAGQPLDFQRAVIATGARPAIPDIEGLVETGFRTNENIFELETLPRRLCVIGGGPIGCELAQAFRRLGSDVHLIQRGGSLLPRDESAAAELIQQRFIQEGINLRLGTRVIKVERAGSYKSLLLESQGSVEKLFADEILVATGRAANVESLGLEAAGVAFTARGVTVDDRLRSSNHSIYAAGDVCGGPQFTHAADAMARICVQNGLFLGRRRLSQLVIPSCTYTDPEVAQIGMTAQAAAKAGIATDTFSVPLAENDRAVLDGETHGLVIVHCRKGTPRVLGATIVAAHAGEMIGELSLLMTRRLTLKHLAATIHCYPTQVEALRRVADQYTRTRLTTRVASLFEKWLAWSRG